MRLAGKQIRDHDGRPVIHLSRTYAVHRVSVREHNISSGPDDTEVRRTALSPAASSIHSAKSQTTRTKKAEIHPTFGPLKSKVLAGSAALQKAVGRRAPQRAAQSVQSG